VGHLLAKIGSIVRISGGTLLSSPSVDSIEDIKISSSKVQRGDLFIDVNSSSIEVDEAIKNGAYGILASSQVKISDDEIAWIKVDNIEKSTIKLARFFSTQKNFRFVPLLKIQYALVKYLHLDKKVELLSSEPTIALLQLLKAQKETLFFVVENSFIQSIDPTLKNTISTIEADKVIENSIFYTSFIYKQRFIKDIRLSSFFVPYLCYVMDYLDDLNIKFKIENFNNFEHFYPQFVSSSLEKKDFGTSRKVLIFENDFELFEKELIYLKKRVDENILVSFTCKDEAMNNLSKLEFRYALIHADKDDFKELLDKKKITQMELFNDFD